MKRFMHVSLGGLLVLWTLAGSGCGLQRLKESNARLKEANDRLTSENNRLEEENAALQQKVAALEASPPDSNLLASANPVPASADIGDDPLLLGPDVIIDRTPDGGIRFTIPDRVFFALGQATITTRGRQTLDKIASLIQTNYPGRTIRVDGHTDDTPIRKVAHKYPTNWELSTARACTVVRYLVERGISPQKIFPAGFAYYRPASYGKSTRDKSQNRRVEITVINDAA